MADDKDRHCFIFIWNGDNPASDAYIRHLGWEGEICFVFPQNTKHQYIATEHILSIQNKDILEGFFYCIVQVMRSSGCVVWTSTTLSSELLSPAWISVHKFSPISITGHNPWECCTHFKQNYNPSPWSVRQHSPLKIDGFESTRRRTHCTQFQILP